MNADDEKDLTQYWNVETVSLNDRIDAAFASAQNHAYSLGYVRGTQEGNAELLEALELVASSTAVLNHLPPEHLHMISTALAHAKAKGQGGE